MVCISKWRTKDVCSPLSNTSDAIAQCLLDEAKRLGIELLTNTSLQHFAPHPEGGFSLTLRKSGEDRVVRCEQLALTTGGAPHGEGFDALKASGHQLETPCPSLFNFRIADESLRQLSGITLDYVLLTLAGTKVRTEGSLLLTHQGISGPAALRLSSHGARLLAERNYRGEILISWLGTTDFDATLSLLKQMQSELSGKTLGAARPTVRPLARFTRTHPCRPRTWGRKSGLCLLASPTTAVAPSVATRRTAHRSPLE